MLSNTINLIRRVSRWGELQCPSCEYWITKRDPEIDYETTVIICLYCKAPMTLGEKICNEANQILENMRLKFKDKK